MTYVLSAKDPLGEVKIPFGQVFICAFCDDLLTRHGYIQITDNQRLKRDGSIEIKHYEIHDVVTGRLVESITVS